MEAAAAGLVAIPADLAGTLRPSQARARLLTAAATALTPREVDVLRMLAEGLGNKHVAARLGISEHTVKTHVTSIFEKLGVSTRAEAVATGVRVGLILL